MLAVMTYFYSVADFFWMNMRDIDVRMLIPSLVKSIQPIMRISHLNKKSMTGCMMDKMITDLVDYSSL